MSGRGGSGTGGKDDAAGSGASAAGAGGTVAVAGSEAAGTGGEAGSDASVIELEPVQGMVIDYYRNPIPNVPVAIGATTVVTDADGKFTIEDVPATYDVSVSLTIMRFGAQELAGYLFVGVTRRDPTLQVYHGLTRRSGRFDRTIENVTFPLPDEQEIQTDWAGQFGEYYGEATSALLHDEASWEGPAAVQGMAHALHFTNSASAPQVPVTYHAHDAHPLAIDDIVVGSLVFDLGSSEPLPTDLVTGNVDDPSDSSRENLVFVRFDDDAVLQVVAHTTSSAAFSYLVPVLPGSAIVVGSMVSSPPYPPYAIAYSDDVAPGSQVELEMPTIPTQLLPVSNESGVDETTEFTWVGPDQVSMFVARADGYYETFYVITAEKRATIPIGQVTVPTLAAGSTYFWQVRVHNAFATVDDATGPEGYLDAICYGRISGPRRGPGSHAETGMRVFTTAQ